MPLFILGLIAVLGGCLLIYYQFGAAISRRFSGAAPRRVDTLERGSMDGAADCDPEEREASDTLSKGGAADGGAAQDADDTRASASEGKVLFLFGDGRREERPLGEAQDDTGE